MNAATDVIEKEHNERGHDPGNGDDDNKALLECEAKSLAETYIQMLFAEGGVFINGKTHTWLEVIDEDSDNILELQRDLHKAFPSTSFTESSEHFAETAAALKDAQLSAVNGWAIRTAREKVDLS